VQFGDGQAGLRGQVAGLARATRLALDHAVRDSVALAESRDTHAYPYLVSPYFVRPPRRNVMKVRFHHVLAW
jgi:hypothetical protein